MLSLLLFACHQDAKPGEHDVLPDTAGLSYGDEDNDGYTVSEGDCDDSNASTSPQAQESCDGIDNNCNGETDENLEQTLYQDLDGDGYGDDTTATSTCETPVGFVTTAGDCNDQNPSIHPEAEESDCTDPIDYNCDGSTGFSDLDGDGVAACEDCNDQDPSIHPNAIEICDPNNIDENCNGSADDLDPTVDPSTQSTVLQDADGDSYGDDATAVLSCDGIGATNGGDCNDQDSAFYPGASEACDDTSDYNCDGSTGYVDADGDGFAACDECNDGDASIHPDAAEICDGLDNNCDGSTDEGASALWYADLDGDGYGDSQIGQYACAQPPGFVADNTDCNDGDTTINPAGIEVCDNLDNDCDGTVDLGAQDGTSWYLDADGDGFGDPNATILACQAQAGVSADNTDCNDGNATINPAGVEVCDGLDNDCDGTVDLGAQDAGVWYTDLDGDGYGDDGSATISCDGTGFVAQGGDCNDGDGAYNPGASESDCLDANDYNCDGITGNIDSDGDGFVACEECNDGDGAVYPGAEERCDGIDNNCDGSTDGNDAVDPSSWYLDGDGDGFGDAYSVAQACDAPTGFVADSSDCDDAHNTVFPNHSEVCDGLDNDCNGLVDDNAIDAIPYFVDLDGDLYGDLSTVVIACSPPGGYTAIPGDCNDQDAAYNPGIVESDCLDPNDYNCDGVTGLVDSDGDGFAACVECNDGDAGVNPAALEVCDQVDNNCDGAVDESGAVGESDWYADNDGDGFGDGGVPLTACTQPNGFVSNDLDCDDSNPDAYPGNSEVCDGLDNDCDGDVDGDAVDAEVYYDDLDGDGFGDAASAILSCDPVPGAVLDSSDCDDLAFASHPGASEVCDGLDNDCDGSVDRGAVDEQVWYQDLDGDGYGDSSVQGSSCEVPAGGALFDGDCDDLDAAYHPNAEEPCNSAQDYNCDGSTGSLDGDGDGYGACEECDDGNAAINPGADERCDGVDNNCDGSVDDTSAVDLSTWYLDSDGDGYGDASSILSACSAPSGFVANDQDCDDSLSSVRPDAVESCNGWDDDCDGSVDEAGAVGETTWYLDGDGDGYGGSTTILSCDAPAGYVGVGGDCDDGDSGFSPGVADICDTLDNDCDGNIDEDGYCPCPVQTYDGTAYMFCSDKKTWNNALIACDSLGYTLASLHTSSENTWLVTTARSYVAGKWWIGGTDAQTEGVWQWTSGELWSYTNWASGQGSSSSQDCTQVGSSASGTWEDAVCTSKSSYICEGG